MVRTAGSILSHRSAKLGRNHDNRIGPLRSQPRLERTQTAVKRRQAQSQSALQGSLIGVGVPTVQGKYRRSGAVRRD